MKPWQSSRLSWSHWRRIRVYDQSYVDDCNQLMSHLECIQHQRSRFHETLILDRCTLWGSSWKGNQISTWYISYGMGEQKDTHAVACISQERNVPLLPSSDCSYLTNQISIAHPHKGRRYAVSASTRPTALTTLFPVVFGLCLPILFSSPIRLRISSNPTVRFHWFLYHQDCVTQCLAQQDLTYLSWRPDAPCVIRYRRESYGELGETRLASSRCILNHS